MRRHKQSFLWSFVASFWSFQILQYAALIFLPKEGQKVRGLGLGRTALAKRKSCLLSVGSLPRARSLLSVLWLCLLSNG